MVAKHSDYSDGEDLFGTYVDLPSINGVRGRLELYSDSLVKGKSQEWGRSHGIFLKIRKRLINLDDPLLGMPAMTHGVFNRTRIIIEADGLNDYITSTRESIKDSAAFNDLKRYLQRKFTEAREYYFSKVEEEEKLNRASYKISHAAGSYSRRPLLVAAKKFFTNDITNLVLTEIPSNLGDKEKEDFIKNLEEDLTSEEGIIKDVRWVALKTEDPIARLDLLTGIANINLMHPFFANFIEDSDPLPFQLFALTEILTEVSMVELGLPEDQIKDIVYRRDNLLRELTFSDKQNAPAVASLINATLSDPDGLEDSLTKAFSALGLETTPIGGNGKPDGIAAAYSGFKNSEENYSVTYDAKSTKKNKIMASTAHISGVDRHRSDYDSDFAVVVAIDFQGSDDAYSAVNKEAKKLKVNLIKASDLISLVLLAGPKQLAFKQLREFFENCHTTLETSEWIKTLKESDVSRGPIKEILESTFKLVKNDTERPDISSIRANLKYENNIELSKEELKNTLQSLETMVPNYISLEGNLVSLQNTPEIILKALNQQSKDQNIPYEYRQLYLQAFGN